MADFESDSRMIKRPRLSSPSLLSVDSISCSEPLEDGTSHQDTVTCVPDGDSLTGGDSGFQDLAGSVPSDSSVAPVSSGLDEKDGDEIRNEDDASVDGDDDSSSSSDDVSDVLSCLSGMSGENWKPVSSGPIAWVQEQISNQISPREILEELLPSANISPNFDNMTLWRLIFGMLSQPPKRKKLPDFNTVSDVVSLIRNSSKIIVLTGAGVSVSCGIPDFRSRDGVYARLSKEFPTLPDPQSMFDIHFFRQDPRPFFKFAKEIYPGQFKPSVSHRFIKQLESEGKLLRNYTQNIDTLEKQADIQNVITCHGSFATASCTRCKHKVDAGVIEDDILKQRIPICPICGPDTPDMAIMKPDIVFFGEGLSDEFHNSMTDDKDVCDLLLVMGSSLKVRPVALIPSSIGPHVPQVLINREPLGHMNFDIELLGDCDVIIRELSNRLGGSFQELCGTKELLQEVSDLPPPLIRPLDAPQNGSPVIQNEEVIPGQISSADDHEVSSSGELSRQTKKSLADRLPESSYLFVPPSRYIFKGAEVYRLAPKESAEDYSSSSDDDDDDPPGGPKSGSRDGTPSSSDGPRPSSTTGVDRRHHFVSLDTFSSTETVSSDISSSEQTESISGGKGYNSLDDEEFRSETSS